MLSAYKYRIYPNNEQKIAFSKHFGCARHVYNWGLTLKQEHYEATGKNLSKRALQDLMVLSKKEEFPWLKEVNSQSLLASLEHLDKAYQNFFKGRARPPQKKKKYQGLQSFQCPQHVEIDKAAGLIHLPKIKAIKIRLHRDFSGVIKTVTIKKTPTENYYVCVLVETDETMPVATSIKPEETLGIDLGITHVLIDSDGHKVANPRHLKKGLQRLASVQKKLSRQKKGSSNRSKQKRLYARVHEKLKNQRHDFIHQETAKLAVKNHATSFVLEDLNIMGMMKNGRLSRAIQDVAWGSFVSALEYKCERQGKNVIKIHRFSPSSKLCHQCGYRIDSLPLSIREWDCPSCFCIHDRDVNAAKNIRAMGLADTLGLSDCVKGSSAAKLVSASAVAKGADVLSA
jgi:putative transposase